ncbi:MAG: SpoIIE family protein phosphatase [Chloroflexi bacterium]|nr:SpoIIE family protein phosphatase [Chloroflexota bacterium]
MRESSSLQRLLGRVEVTALLQSFAASDHGLAVALLQTDGQVFASSGNWSPVKLKGLESCLSEAFDRDEFQVDGLRGYALRAGSQRVGTLVAQGGSSANLEQPLAAALKLLLAQALEKRNMANEALERYREINLMYRIGETIGSSLDMETIPGRILQESERVIHADVGIVLLAKSEAEWEIKASYGDQDAARILDGILSCMPRRNPAIVTDASPFSAILYAPLRTQDQLLGGVALGRLNDRRVFTASDEKLLMALTGQAAIALENSRLHQADLERERLQHEAQLARDVQVSLMPRATPQIAGWEFAAYWQPAREVSGDFYDFVSVGAQHDAPLHGLVIADVSDKGMHAALFMALTRSIVRASAAATMTPAQMLDQANRLICHDAANGMFVTLFYAQLNPTTGELAYVNAGHNRPLLYRAAGNELTELSQAGLAAGIIEDLNYEESFVRMDVGDLLVLYTDGVTDATDEQEQPFGEERLRRVLLDHRGASAADVTAGLQSALRDFIGATAQFDDITVVVAKRV